MYSGELIYMDNPLSHDARVPCAPEDWYLRLLNSHKHHRALSFHAAQPDDLKAK